MTDSSAQQSGSCSRINSASRSRIATRQEENGASWHYESRRNKARAARAIAINHGDAGVAQRSIDREDTHRINGQSLPSYAHLRFTDFSFKSESTTEAATAYIRHDENPSVLCDLPPSAVLFGSCTYRAVSPVSNERASATRSGFAEAPHDRPGLGKNGAKLENRIPFPLHLSGRRTLRSLRLPSITTTRRVFARWPAPWHGTAVGR